MTQESYVTQVTVMPVLIKTEHTFISNTHLIPKNNIFDIVVAHKSTYMKLGHAGIVDPFQGLIYQYRLHKYEKEKHQHTSSGNQKNTYILMHILLLSVPVIIMS